MSNIHKLKSLYYLSSDVFDLEGKHKMILRHLAIKKNPERGASQTEISRVTEHHAEKKFRMRRRIMVKRLRGTNKIMGLIPTGYVYERKENKHRFKKNESTFHLTFKGMLAVLSNGMSIKKNYLFKNYINMISNLLDNKKIVKFIEEYFILQIHVFLLWHYLAGIQLKKQKEHEAYFHEFFQKPEMSDFEIFAQNIIGKKIKTGERKEYDVIKEIFLDYATSNYIIKTLKEEDVIPSSTSFLKWKKVNSDLSIGEISYSDRHKYELHRLIDFWSVFLVDLHGLNNGLDDVMEKLVYQDLNEEDVQEEYDKKFKYMLKQKSKPLGIKIKLPLIVSDFIKKKRNRRDTRSQYSDSEDFGEIHDIPEAD
ncbi:MAG: hypothetical protein K8Q89_05090 [Nitrosarchaeum sp.]|nr:hypothetical protein [Nitrosarchaeum sp.]